MPQQHVGALSVSRCDSTEDLSIMKRKGIPKPVASINVEMMTAKEVAADFKISVSQLYNLFHEGKIPGIRIGGAYRFLRSDVLSYVEQNRQQYAG